MLIQSTSTQLPLFILLLLVGCTQVDNHTEKSATIYYFKFYQKSLFQDSFATYVGSHTFLDSTMKYEHLIQTKDAIWLYGDSAALIYDIKNSAKAKKVGLELKEYVRHMDIYWLPVMKPALMDRFDTLMSGVSVTRDAKYIAVRLPEKHDPNGMVRDPYRTSYHNRKKGFVDSLDSYATIESKEDYMMDVWKLDSISEHQIIPLKHFTEEYWDSVTGLYKLVNRQRVLDSILKDSFNLQAIEKQVIRLRSDFNLHSEKLIIYFWYYACYPCHLLKKDLKNLIMRHKDVRIVAINPYDTRESIESESVAFMTNIYDQSRSLRDSFNVIVFPKLFLFNGNKFVGSIEGYYDEVADEILTKLY